MLEKFSFGIFLLIIGLWITIVSIKMFLEFFNQLFWPEAIAKVYSVTQKCVEYGSGDMGWIEVFDISYNVDSVNHRQEVKYRTGLNYFYAPFKSYTSVSGILPGNDIKIYYNPKNHLDITFKKTKADILTIFYLGIGLTLIIFGCTKIW